MSYSEALSSHTVAISVSNSPDLGGLGMSEAHLRDATAELARHLIALGARVAYGGDLRHGGFTEILFELVARHRRDADEGDARSAVLSYLAWPVHIAKPMHDLERYRNELAGLATLVLLDPDGEPLAFDARRELGTRNPALEEWAPALTAMRRSMNANASARIVAGGQVADFLGAIPGVAEEARIAIDAGCPLYVLGGFGGCAADIAQAMSLADFSGVEPRDWGQKTLFSDFVSDHLVNGLTKEENHTLAATPHVDEAIALILRGLLRLEKQRDAEG